MSKREFYIALAALMVLAVLMGTITWRQCQRADAIRQQAQQQWQHLSYKLQERQRLREHIGLATVHQRDEEDVLRRVRQSLQDLGLPLQRMRSVRPREERSVQEGAAIQQSVHIELQELSPADIGAWLVAWNKAENPWRIQGMTWRHHKATRTAAGGNLYDVHLSCTALLVP